MDNKPSIVDYLTRESFVIVKDCEFIPYAAVVMGLNLSSHVRQLEKRQASYPDHFTTIEGKPYVSVVYAIRLERFHTALKELNALKGKEVSNG